MSCYSCDIISKFTKEMIVKTNNEKDKVKKRELINEFKAWFISEQGGNSKMPSGEELYAYMDKKYGVCKQTTGWWHGVKILYPDVEEEEDMQIDDDNL